jgi:hypothetical protein
LTKSSSSTSSNDSATYIGKDKANLDSNIILMNGDSSNNKPNDNQLNMLASISVTSLSAQTQGKCDNELTVNLMNKHTSSLPNFNTNMSLEHSNQSQIVLDNDKIDSEEAIPNIKSNIVSDSSQHFLESPSANEVEKSVSLEEKIAECPLYKFNSTDNDLNQCSSLEKRESELDRQQHQSIVNNPNLTVNESDSKALYQSKRFYETRSKSLERIKYIKSTLISSVASRCDNVIVAGLTSKYSKNSQCLTKRNPLSMSSSSFFSSNESNPSSNSTNFNQKNIENTQSTVAKPKRATIYLKRNQKPVIQAFSSNSTKLVPVNVASAQIDLDNEDNIFDQRSRSSESRIKSEKIVETVAKVCRSLDESDWPFSEQEKTKLLITISSGINY